MHSKGKIVLKRKLYDYLLRWKEKDRSSRKPLVVKGSRQVGKTTIVRDFAEKNYENVVYLDFRKMKGLRGAFNGDFDIDSIVAQLTARMPDAKVVPGKTVFIFDEVQDCNNARASLKYFHLDGRYDVICTGSMLGIKGYNRDETDNRRGVPVGFEEIVTMHPLDFEEFLWAYGITDDAIAMARECFEKRKQLPQVLHETFLELFRYYICVGGMPEVVLAFLENKDMNAAYAVQQQILTEYKSDFGAHIDSKGEISYDLTLRQRILECFNSIPAQLAKENKKFQYTVMKKNAKGREYKEPLEWLADAGIIAKCHNLSLLQMPLSAYKEESVFKVYLQDCGLLMGMLDPGTAGLVVSGDLGFFKGAIYENIIADAFCKAGRELFYFSKDSNLEIDFVTFWNGQTTIIEVKARSGDSKSAKTVLSDNRNDVEKCIKFTAQNIGEVGQMLTLPYYLAFLVAP